MPFFIKSESIRKDCSLNQKEKSSIIKEHILWVKRLKAKGIKVKSGYLIDELRKPGGGGILIIESKSYIDAKEILKNDPMIKSNLVKWKLFEWINTIDHEGL